MTRKLILIAIVLLAAVALLIPTRATKPVQAAGPARFAVLIALGTDGKPKADWSGSLSPAPRRIAAWQLHDPDAIEGAAGWKATTREEPFWDTPYEASMGPTARKTKVAAKGVVAEYDLPEGTEITVSTRQGDFRFALSNSLWTAPQAALGGRAQVRAAPSPQVFATGEPAEDYPSLARGKDGVVWMAYQSWTPQGDRIYSRRLTTAGWSEAEAVLDTPADCFRTAIAPDRRGQMWTVWSQQTSGAFHLYGSRHDGKRWSRPERLTSGAGSSQYHALAAGQDGQLYLAWQAVHDGQFDIFLQSHDGSRWSKPTRVSESPANDWQPALAAVPGGGVTVLWDSYANGNYDVVSRTWKNGSLGPLEPIANTGAFEARASAQYDAQGRLWVAWEEGDWAWGKDYGNLIPESGRGLLVRRHARVGVRVNGRLLAPARELASAVPEEYRQAFLEPRLVLDTHGSPWVFFRYRTNNPQGIRGEVYRGMWRQGASTLRDGQWIPAIEFPEAYGRIDSPLAALATADGISVALSTDGRRWPQGFPGQQDLHFAAFPTAAPARPPEFTAFRPSTDGLMPSHPQEAEDVARIRAYRAASGGQHMRIVRGDIHRHTDISWDGNRDGSLDDAYRYALDAVAFDYLGVCDHQAGGGVPYHWEMIQKAVDRFTIPGRFAPVYSYERSLSWPNGHRNVVFARRGNPVLAIPEAEARGREGAAKLYEYLRGNGGITTSHTSATGAGTDFRDNDPEVEPVVEIYQGYRTNYEGPDSPRWRDPGRFAAGQTQAAWGKGIKMGVQASSDHVSTHISYAAVYVTDVTRQAIVDGLKARRSYAATDNIIVDLRAGDRFMGSAGVGHTALSAYAHGTGPVSRVVVIRDGRVVHTAAGPGPEMRFQYRDPEGGSGDHYYYIRVEQEDGQVAWSSPVWTGE